MNVPKEDQMLYHAVDTWQTEKNTSEKLCSTIVIITKVVN